MKTKRTSEPFQGQVISVGLDVHLRSWSVVIRSCGIELERYQSDPDPSQLVGHLHRCYPGGNYQIAYEAGCCGFWIHRQLSEYGCCCQVVNPADIASTDKERRRKTDRRDARKLARELENNALHPIYVPNPALEQLRQISRLRERLSSHSTRLKQRLKGYLALDGITLPPQSECSHWSANFLAWVEAQCEHSGRPEALLLTLNELREERPRIVHATRAMRAFLDEHTDLAYTIQLLESVPGIGFVTAVTLLSEIADIQRFPRLDHLASYVGLVSDTYSSGEHQRDTGLTKRRNRYLRHLLIESSWVAIRKDQDLFHTYTAATTRMKRSRAILPVARRLLSRIRAVWRDQRAYQPNPINRESITN